MWNGERWNLSRWNRNALNGAGESDAVSATASTLNVADRLRGSAIGNSSAMGGMTVLAFLTNARRLISIATARRVVLIEGASSRVVKVGADMRTVKIRGERAAS